MNTEKEKELNKIKGKRLRECRGTMQQSVLAEKLGYTANYISMMENGGRPIDWNKAVEIAKILNVNPAYIMHQSDFKYPTNPGNSPYHCNSSDDCTISIIGSEDRTDFYFLNFLISLGYEIRFNVVFIQNTMMHPIECRIADLYKFSFWDERCIVKDAETAVMHECLINAVRVDDMELSYSEFCFLLHRMYAHIEFTLNGIMSLKEDLRVLKMSQIKPSFFPHNIEK